MKILEEIKENLKSQGFLSWVAFIVSVIALLSKLFQ